MTVNLDDQAYAVLLTLASREDAPVAQIARRAVMDFLTRQAAQVSQPALPLIRSQARSAGQGQ